MTYNTLITGAPQTGKTTQLIRRALDSLTTGRQVVFIDPKGHAVDEIIRRVPPDLTKQVVALNLANTTPTPIRLATDPNTVRDLLRDTAKYGNSSTPVFDRLVYYTAASVLDKPHATILDMKYMLLSDTYRQHVLKAVDDPVVKAFWEFEYAEWDAKKREDRIQSTLNQLDVVLTDPTLRTTFCYPDAADWIDTNSLFIKLPLGSQTTRVAGLILLTLIPPGAHVFIDDTSHFDGTLLTKLLTDRTNITITLTTVMPYRHLLNISGEKVVMRLGGDDADLFEKMLKVPPQATRIHELADYHAYHVRPGERPRRDDPLPDIEHRAFKGSPKAIRLNRPHVQRRTVEAAVRQSVELHLCSKPSSSSR